MTAATKLGPIDWLTYLDGEERAERKHEYVCGYMYAMSGARRQHNLIASNVLSTLHQRLRGTPCRAYGSDMKVHIRTDEGHRFYYPDVTVECGPHDPHSVYSDDPVVVVEVLSPSTRRIDEGEKKSGYLAIPSLAAYVLIDSKRPCATVWRRTATQFKPEFYADPAALIPLSEINASLPFGEVYANAEWPRDGEAEEEM